MPGMRCAVAACNQSYIESKKTGGSSLSFHKFPVNEFLRKKWINACDRPDSWSPGTSRICGRHFEKEDFETDLRPSLMYIETKKKLIKTAVPTLHLKRHDKQKAFTSTCSNHVKKLKMEKCDDEFVEESLSADSQNFLENEPDAKQKNMLSNESKNSEDLFKAKYEIMLAENNKLRQKIKVVQASDRTNKKKIKLLEGEIVRIKNSLKVKQMETAVLQRSLHKVFTENQTEEFD